MYFIPLYSARANLVEWNFSPGNAVGNEVILHANAKSPRTPDGFNEMAAHLHNWIRDFLNEHS